MIPEQPKQATRWISYRAHLLSRMGRSGWVPEQELVRVRREMVLVSDPHGRRVASRGKAGTRVSLGSSDHSGCGTGRS